MSVAWDGRPPGEAAEQSAHRLLAAPGFNGARAEFSAIWDGGFWWTSPGPPVRPKDATMWDWRYLGPCLTPAEVAAREAAAEKRGMERAAEIVEAWELWRPRAALPAAIRAAAGEIER